MRKYSEQNLRCWKYQQHETFQQLLDKYKMRWSAYGKQKEPVNIETLLKRITKINDALPAFQVSKIE